MKIEHNTSPLPPFFFLLSWYEKLFQWGNTHKKTTAYIGLAPA